MDSSPEAVFLPSWEGLPIGRRGQAVAGFGEGDLFCLCSSSTILFLDSTETAAPLMHPWA